MIATGGYYRGPELSDSLICRMLNFAGRAAKAVRGEWRQGDTPGVIVLFVVPGSLGDVSFSGQRTTLFSRKKKLLQVEAAVPVDLLTVEQISDFIIDALQQAIRTAVEHFERKKAGVFDIAGASAIVDAVRKALSDYREE